MSFRFLKHRDAVRRHIKDNGSPLKQVFTASVPHRKICGYCADDGCRHCWGKPGYLACSDRPCVLCSGQGSTNQGGCTNCHLVVKERLVPKSSED